MTTSINIYSKKPTRIFSKLFNLYFFLTIIVSFFFSTVNAQTNPANITSTSFKVFGVCEDCQHRIENSLKVKGIQSAKWDVNTKMLAVSYDSTTINLNRIQSRILAVGHDLELKKAKNAVYEALPECCRYRNLKEGTPAHSDEAESTKGVSGIVVAEDNKGNLTPLAGASIFWSGSKEGVTSDHQGAFFISKNKNVSQLVVSYTGFQADSIDVSNADHLQVVLASKGVLSTIKINAKPRPSYINNLGAVRSLMINSKDLLKAACCNLSESFETNPSVDVSYSDAVTGSKQIQLLGLAGIYTQLTVENLPGPRGIATPLGLNSIAGPWIESIQLSKGTGSVANGFESIAGQINVELKDLSQVKNCF